MNKQGSKKNRCFTVLIFAFYLFAFSASALAQSTPVTVKLENAKLEDVIKAVEDQTRYLFLYKKGVDLNRKVSISVRNKPLKEVLDRMAEGANLEYAIQDMYIILSVRQAGADLPATVRGVVVDGAGPIPGATVAVPGSGKGTITDMEGRFRLEGVATGETLRVSYLGYQSQDIVYNGQADLRIVMKEITTELDQVVITALGIKREQKALSYNVQQVSTEAVTTVKSANFINSLAGKVAGAQINSSSSGVGGASKVILRGQKSIAQSSNALYVIDGIPMYNFGGGGETEFGSKGATEGIADINPEDIESISVLTGAAAAALYGSNAANGAIMITTKKGEAGKLRITLSNNTEFMKPFVMPEFQNRYGTGSRGERSGSGVYSWGEKLEPGARTGYAPKKFFDTGHVTTSALTLSGGTDRNQTYFSAASVNSKGIVPNNIYDRYNFTFRNTTLFFNNRLKVDGSASYIYQRDQNMTNQGVYSNPVVPAYLFPRGEEFSIYKDFERYDPAQKIMTQFWPVDLEGGDLRMQNPYWIARRNLRNTNKKRYMFSLTASFDITDWLSIMGRVRIDNANSLYTQKLYASSNLTVTEGGKLGHYTEARGDDAQTYADAMLNFNKTFGCDWSLTANLGASVNNTKADDLSYAGPIQENGLPNVFNVFDLDKTKSRAKKEGWREQTQSLFAAAELGWRSMLYLTLTGRNDWASQLAGSPQSSFFYPSVGISWIPTSTWDMGAAVSYLKLRGSIASVGVPFPRHLTTPTYKYDDTTQSWVPKTHYPIGDLHPERTRTYELGLDARLWKNLSVSASWYYAETYNQTFDPQISVSSGYSTIYLQTGHVRNTGVEAHLGYDNEWKGVGWESNFTFSWNKNRIVELVHNYKHPETGELITKDRLEIKGLGKAKYILKPGGTLGDLYTNSDLRYNEAGYIEIDSGGNPIVDDNYDDILLGSVFPKFNLAWSNTFRWKGAHLNVLLTGRIGGICYSATQANADLFGVSKTSAQARDAGGVLVNDRFLVDAQSWYQTIGSQAGLPQYYTYSATNFRLQELSVGYTLPGRWFGDICTVDLSMVGRNLWMIYNKAPFDPEAVASTGVNYQGIDYFMVPSLRNIGFSVKLTF